MIKTTLGFAGEFFLDTILLSSADGVDLNIANQVSAILIYEDMFSPFISGTLFMKDTLDLPNIIGRSGLNRLTLKLFTPTIEDRKQINLVCHIYKHGERVLSADRTQQYSFQFISEESINNQKRISSSFSGNPNDLVSGILKKHLNTKKQFFSSKTTNNIKYVSNFWTPTQNISYIVDHSRGKDGENFLFFENRDGFNMFCPSEFSSKEVKTIQEFSNMDYVSKSKNKSMPEKITKDINMDYRSILSINLDTVYDYIKDYDAGMIKSRMYIADPVLKKYKIENFDIRNDTKSKLNANRLYSDRVVEASPTVIMSSLRQYNTHSMGDSTNFDYMQKRISQLRQFQSSKIEIEVFGRTDYTVGKKVYLDMNQVRSFTMDDKAEDFLDKVTTGYYIISAVVHKFAGDKHTALLELIKDSTELQ